ncbi:hypothetical protein ACVFYP_18300 [Roseomonas sp. F4]
MRLRGWLVGLALGLGVAPAAEANEIWRRSSGQWTVKLFQNQGDRAWCSWDTRFQSSGRIVSFMLNSQGLHLFISAPNMRLDRLRGQQAAVAVGGRAYPVTFTFGNFNDRNNLGGAAGLITAEPRAMRGFIVDFAQASSAEIRFASGVNWGVGLRGTQASLPHMTACVTEMRQRNGSGFDMDPTARPAPPGGGLDPTARPAPPSGGLDPTGPAPGPRPVPGPAPGVGLPKG